MHVDDLLEGIQHLLARLELARCNRSSDRIRPGGRAGARRKGQVDMIQVRKELFVVSNVQHKLEQGLASRALSHRQRSHVIEGEHILHGWREAHILGHDDKVCVFVDHAQREALAQRVGNETLHLACLSPRPRHILLIRRALAEVPCDRRAALLNPGAGRALGKVVENVPDRFSPLHVNAVDQRHPFTRTVRCAGTVLGIAPVLCDDAQRRHGACELIEIRGALAAQHIDIVAWIGRETTQHTDELGRWLKPMLVELLRIFPYECVLEREQNEARPSDAPFGLHLPDFQARREHGVGRRLTEMRAFQLAEHGQHPVLRGLGHHRAVQIRPALGHLVFIHRQCALDGLGDLLGMERVDANTGPQRGVCAGEFREDERAFALLLRNHILMRCEVHTFSQRRGHKGVGHGEEGQVLAEGDFIDMQEDHGLIRQAAVLAVDARHNIAHVADFVVLLHRRERHLDQDDTSHPLRVLVQEELKGQELFAHALDPVQLVAPDNHAHPCKALLELRDPFAHVGMLAALIEHADVNADGKRCHRDERALQDDAARCRGQLQYATDRLAEMLEEVVRLESNQIRAEHASKQLLAPAEAPENLAGREGNVHKQPDRCTRQHGTDHGRHQKEVVVMNPDHVAFAVLGHDAIRKALVHFDVGVKRIMLGLERLRTRLRIVEGGPQNLLAIVMVAADIVVVLQPHRHAFVLVHRFRIDLGAHVRGKPVHLDTERADIDRLARDLRAGTVDGIKEAVIRTWIRQELERDTLL